MTSQKMKFSLKLTAFVIAITMIVSGFAPILISASNIGKNQPTIVTFNNSEGEKIAVSKILENFPNADVFSYDETFSNEFLRRENSIIWIGHSDIRGIEFQDQIISWNTIYKQVQSSMSLDHYFLACESSIISQISQNTNKNVYSFDIKIDAEFGSNLVSAIIAKRLQTNNFLVIFAKLINRFNELSEGAEEILLRLEDPSPPPPPPPPPDPFGPSEKAYHTFNLVILALMVILPLSMAAISSSVIAKSFLTISAYSTTVAVFKFTVDLFFHISEGSSGDTILAAFAKLMGALATWIVVFLRVVLSNVGWLSKIKISAVVTAESTLLTTAIKWAAIIAILIGISYQIYISYNAYYTDLNDADDNITFA